MIFNLAEWKRGANFSLSYSGTHSVSANPITFNGASYRLWEITGTGTLTVKGDGTVPVWLCGGGAMGSTLSSELAFRGCGGGGAYFAQNLALALTSGAYNVTIGASGGTTSIARNGSTLLSANGATGKNGGSGGGGASSGASATRVAGTGGGKSTRPFGDSTNFPSLPCAGGGGKLSRDTNKDDDGMSYIVGGDGGKGGSNGSNGTAGMEPQNYYNSPTTGAGGATGGGAAAGLSGAASNATYYGSGGGGNTSYNIAAASGYQGVVFMLEPAGNTPAPTPTAYQYYRLNMTGMMRGSTSGTFFSVAELKLYNGSMAISYTGATLTASSSLSGYPVAQAFDGNTSTIWHVDGSPTSAWIQAQLSSASKVTSFSITARSDQNDRLNAFTLAGSNDGSTWTTLYTATNVASGWTQGAEKTFTI